MFSGGTGSLCPIASPPGSWSFCSAFGGSASFWFCKTIYRTSLLLSISVTCGIYYDLLCLSCWNFPGEVDGACTSAFWSALFVMKGFVASSSSSSKLLPMSFSESLARSSLTSKSSFKSGPFEALRWALLLSSEIIKESSTAPGFPSSPNFGFCRCLFWSSSLPPRPTYIYSSLMLELPLAFSLSGFGAEAQISAGLALSSSSSTSDKMKPPLSILRLLLISALGLDFTPLFSGFALELSWL